MPATTKPEANELIWLGSVLSGVLVLTGLAGLMTTGGGLWAVSGVSLFIGLAAFATGSALGFIFGVPRVLAKPQEGQSADAAPAASDRRLLTSNTNLERISDWLTTMIVGVALTQLHNVATALDQFHDFLAAARIGCPATGTCVQVLPVTGPAVLVLGLLCGFLFMYLYTRLMLTALFKKIEEDLLAQDETSAVKAAARNVGAGDTMATRQILEKETASVEDALTIMFSALYRPGGYEEVIQLAGQLSGGPAAKRPDYWFYLAAAFGQKHAAAQQADDSAGVNSARDNALDAARRAISLDPSYRARLAGLTNPDASDNDLASLREDPGLRQLLRL